ncbi:chalcone isomerase family protein [Kaarinaea lacus]
MVKTRNTTVSIVTQGQSFKSLHAPNYCSAPFFIVCMIVCLFWMPVGLAEQDATTKLPQQARHLGLSMVGEGAMTWLGFSIYKASLWTQNGTYHGINVERASEQKLALSRQRFQDTAYTFPIALHIVYEKNISSEILVKTTIKEWRRLKIFDESQYRYYAPQLRSIWPDVKPGDSITTVIDNNQHTIFFANGREAGKIIDKDFGPALLAVWLHPKTRAANLRADLIGLQGG